MPRWIAVGKAQGWDDLERLTKEMKQTNEWRLDPRTTITSVYALGDGRVVAECHGQSQADFDQWLQKKGITVESVSPIKAVAKTGEVWKVNN
jgi:hypothetical protein